MCLHSVVLHPRQTKLVFVEKTSDEVVFDKSNNLLEKQNKVRSLVLLFHILLIVSKLSWHKVHSFLSKNLVVSGTTILTLNEH